MKDEEESVGFDIFFVFCSMPMDMAGMMFLAVFALMAIPLFCGACALRFG